MTDKGLSRRRFTQSLGIVVASFALAPRVAFGQTPGTLPFSLRNNQRLEGWIRLEPDETVTVFTGKAELGQGILTALAQIAAEELDGGFEKIRMVAADTSRGPDEQYTFGSQSVEQSGNAIRAASAEARGILLAAAARRFGVRPEDLQTKAGIIASPDGKRATFWEVASADPDLLKGDITGEAAPKKPSDYSIVGKSINRIDLPGKLTGAPSYVQDMRLPGDGLCESCPSTAPRGETGLARRSCGSITSWRGSGRSGRQFSCGCREARGTGDRGAQCSGVGSALERRRGRTSRYYRFARRAEEVSRRDHHSGRHRSVRAGARSIKKSQRRVCPLVLVSRIDWPFLRRRMA